MFLAALLLTVIAYVFSYVWFGPWVFSNLYMRHLEKSNQAPPHPRPLIFGLFFALTYLGMLVLGYFVYRLAGGDFWAGARMGFYLWLFYLSLEFANSLFSRVNLIVQSISWAFWLLVAIFCGGAFSVLAGVRWPPV